MIANPFRELATRRPTQKAGRVTLLIFSATILAVCLGYTSTASATHSSATNAVASHVVKCKKFDNLKVSVYPGNINGFGVYIASQRGFFTANCIKMTPVNVTNANAAFAATVQGDINLVITNPDVAIAANAHGLNVQIVGSMLNHQANALVATKGTSLPHSSQGFPAVMQDLVGKRIGVTALGSGTEGTARALFQAAGLSPSSATYVPIGGTATELAAMSNHAVDAAVMFGDGQDIAEADGFGTIIADLRKDGPWGDALNAMQGTAVVYAAQTSFVSSHSGLMTRFLAANHAALAWAHNPKNLGGVYKVIRTVAPLGGEVPNFQSVLKKACALYASIGSDKISVKAIAAWNAFAVSLNEIPKPVPFETVVWPGSKHYWGP